MITDALVQGGGLLILGMCMTLFAYIFFSCRCISGFAAGLVLGLYSLVIYCIAFKTLLTAFP